MNPTPVALAKLPVGTHAVVRALRGEREGSSRLSAMGMIAGAPVETLQNRDTGAVLVRVRDTRIALGRGSDDRQRRGAQAQSLSAGQASDPPGACGTRAQHDGCGKERGRGDRASRLGREVAVVGGAGLVITLAPILVVLFAVLALLEDTGYLARAAYVTDRFMHPLGLHA